MLLRCDAATADRACAVQIPPHSTDATRHPGAQTITAKMPDALK